MKEQSMNVCIMPIGFEDYKYKIKEMLLPESIARDIEKIAIQKSIPINENIVYGGFKLEGNEIKVFIEELKSIIFDSKDNNLILWVENLIKFCEEATPEKYYIHYIAL